jgi:hypothetical protein
MTSAINPNNIDGNYPVPGVPNNTQGFRSNFTETKTNFQFAAQEITDLQTNALLKAPLSGTTLDNNMNGGLIYDVKLQDIGYTYLPVAATSGTVTIDYSVAPFQQINPVAPVSLNFINWPAAGTAGQVRVAFNVTNVSQTLTLPAVVTQGINGLQGAVPGTPGVSNTITFGRPGNYAFEFATVDSGTNVWVFDDSRPNSNFADTVTITNETESVSTSTGALVVAGGAAVGGNLYVGGNIVGNIVVTGISLTGNVTGANVNTSGLVSAVGNVRGGNLVSLADISAAGNITGINLITDTLALTGNVTTAFNVTGNVTGGNIRTPGAVTASGNVTGGNIRTTGSVQSVEVSASGNVTGGNLVTTGTVSASGSVTGSTLAGGSASITGNIIAGNIQITGVAAEDFVQTASLTATGNVIGNILISNVIQTSGNITSNISIANTVIAAGNVTGNILIGNTVIGNVLIGNSAAVPDLTVSQITTGDSSVLQILDNINVQGDVLFSGNISPAAVGKIGGIVPGPGVDISEQGVLTIDTSGLPLSFGDFTANNNILTIVDANENMILATSGNAEIQLVGNIGFYTPNGLPPNVANRYFSATDDGQIQIFVTTTDSEGAVQIIGSTTGNTIPPGTSGTLLHLTGQLDIPCRSYYDGNGDYVSWVARRWNGNVDSPTQVLAGEDVLRINSTAATDAGGGNVGNVAMAQIRTTALENQTATAQGSSITFTVTPVGSPANARVDVATITTANGVSATRLTSSNPTGGIGYIAGAGGTVTQNTSKSTGVVLNTLTGQITMSSEQLGGDATVEFAMNNSAIGNTDVMIINQVGGGNIGEYAFNAVCYSGSANISVHNMTNTNRSDAIVLRYAVIKGATS